MLELGQATKKTTGVTYTNPSEQRDFNSLVEKYMLLDKKTLAELLALKESQYLTYPAYPYVPPQVPWVTYREKEQCANPYHDCINCPYSYTGCPVEARTNLRYTTSTTADEQ